MGWTAGHLRGPFSSAAAIAFEMGDEFASRIVDTARYGTVIYAAVRSREEDQVFGLVLLAERSRGVLYTKPIGEHMGPAEDWCPKVILDLLSEPSNEQARDRRGRCRARIERGHPSPGQLVIFTRPLKFFDGTEHTRLTFVGGSRFAQATVLSTASRRCGPSTTSWGTSRTDPRERPLHHLRIRHHRAEPLQWPPKLALRGRRGVRGSSQPHQEASASRVSRAGRVARAPRPADPVIEPESSPRRRLGASRRKTHISRERPKH